MCDRHRMDTEPGALQFSKSTASHFLHFAPFWSGQAESLAFEKKLADNTPLVLMYCGQINIQKAPPNQYA